MLNTILQIGRVLLDSPDGFKHHRYMEDGPYGDEKKQIEYWTVTVGVDGSFELSRCIQLIDEEVMNRLYFLNYVTSDADRSMKYIFGDLYWFTDGEMEGGNFRLSNPQNNAKGFQANSFVRGEQEAKTISSPVISGFRQHLSKKIKVVEGYLRRTQRKVRQINSRKPERDGKQVIGIYLHFDFGGKHWYQLAETMDKINALFLRNFYAETPHGYVLTSYLYKTLVGDKKSSDRIPGFNAEGKKLFRTHVFRSEERLPLLYGIKCSSHQFLRAGDMKIIVLPRGRNLTAAQIERFFEKTGLIEEEEAEAELNRETVTFEEIDPLFACVPNNDESDPNLLQFDFIFSRVGGTKPEVDLIELGGVERSRLAHISQRVRHLRREIIAERTVQLSGAPKKPLNPPTITRSFLNLLGDTTKAKKKYQRHLLKALPEIYTETYFHDPVLLPALIRKTEDSIRNNSSLDFNTLKWDFYFLTRLQNSRKYNQGDHLMEIQNAPSYRVGLMLGKLARGLRSKINSFDKNYAGLISRRIATLPDVLRLHNEINQKLIMHDRAGLAFKFSGALTEELKNFTGRYDKDECAFGFLESYFAPYKSGESGEEDVDVVPIECLDTPG